MARYILDASAILALWFGEPIDQESRHCFSDAAMSAVNYAEALSVVVRDGYPEADFQNALNQSDIEIVPFDEPTARLAGNLISVTGRYGLSLGDRACLALAIQTRTIAVTADRIWRELDFVDVQVIR